MNDAETVECNEFRVVEAHEPPTVVPVITITPEGKVTGLVSMDDIQRKPNFTIRADRFVLNGREVTFDEYKAFLEWYTTAF
jgi:hypothetical protein